MCVHVYSYVWNGTLHFASVINKILSLSLSLSLSLYEEACVCMRLTTVVPLSGTPSGPGSPSGGLLSSWGRSTQIGAGCCLRAQYPRSGLHAPIPILLFQSQLPCRLGEFLEKHANMRLRKRLTVLKDGHGQMCRHPFSAFTNLCGALLNRGILNFFGVGGQPCSSVFRDFFQIFAYRKFLASACLGVILYNTTGPPLQLPCPTTLNTAAESKINNPYPLIFLLVAGCPVSARVSSTPASGSAEPAAMAFGLFCLGRQSCGGLPLRCRETKKNREQPEKNFPVHHVNNSVLNYIT